MLSTNNSSHSAHICTTVDSTVLPQSKKLRRYDGTGSLYLRGKVWWVKYSQAGKVIRESTGTDDRNYAEDFLRARVYSPRIRAALPELCASTRCSIGAIAELTTSVALMNLGYSVYRSFSHNAPCDLVAISGSLILRIEVKTITAAGKLPTVDRTKFDHLALLVRGGEIEFRPPLPTSLVSESSA
jgi:hypothetical protein